jgi:hypothetical protein
MALQAARANIDHFVGLFHCSVRGRKCGCFEFGGKLKCDALLRLDKIVATNVVAPAEIVLECRVRLYRDEL